MKRARLDNLVEMGNETATDPMSVPVTTPEDIQEYGKAIRRPVKLDKAVVAYFQEKFSIEPDSELRVGYAMTSFIWFNIAKSIVESAVKTYHCTPEQAEALRRVYLRSSHYVVEAYAD